MNREFYPDVLKRKDIQGTEPEQQKKQLQPSGGRKAVFTNNTFNNCIFIFNFKGPEDNEEVADE